MRKVDGGSSAASRRAVPLGRKFTVRAPGNQPLAVAVTIGKFRRYRGRLTFSIERRASGDSISIRNDLPLFDYVASVVGSESDRSFAIEALKAQAVLVQTRLSTERPGTVLGDSTESMVYLGADYESALVLDAVRSVNGVVLMQRDRPIHAFFHSCCAGSTSRGVDIFGASARSLDYLASVPCNFCKSAPLFHQTERSIPNQIFQREISDKVPLVKNRDRAGRPLQVEIVRGKKSALLSGYRLWILLGQKLGWDKVPGTRYSFETDWRGDILVKSTGGGHGVGLCQWGAAGLAAAGKTYNQILNYYFPGTALSD